MGAFVIFLFLRRDITRRDMTNSNLQLERLMHVVWNKLVFLVMRV